MTFSNNVSYMVKILAFYIIMTQIFTKSQKGLSNLVLHCTISVESYMILMSIGSQKTAINNKVRALDPFK